MTGVPVRLTPLAEEDVAAAQLWYEQQRAGLGLQFVDAVDICVRRIARNPRAWQVVRGEVRRAILRRFPYCVYFVVQEREAIIIAVLHGHRSPSTWRGRT